MKIEKSKKDSTYQVVVLGSVKTLEETREIRDVLEQIIDNEPKSHIQVYLKDTDTITSSLIGVLLKLIYGENSNIEVLTTSEQLYKLVERLNLVNTLKLKLVKE